jgi:hypothetical protein
MPKKAIPDDVKERVAKIVENFNKKKLKKYDCRYVAKYKGKYLYLARDDMGEPEPICRLEYTGDMSEWDFAIYKYSSNRYDAGEIFPGIEDVNGTIEGAMKAGMKAYPI